MDAVLSHASLLRDRLGYANELRAVGDVLIDQVPLMLRCGFDSFAVSNATALKRLAEKRLPGIDVHYQPAARASKAWPILQLETDARLERSARLKVEL